MLCVCVWKDLVRNISMAEVVTTRAQSLLSKFTQDYNNTAGLSSTDVHGFVSDLLEQPEVNIIGAARAPLGVIIHRLFIASHKVCISCMSLSACNIVMYQQTSDLFSLESTSHFIFSTLS